jgi:ATPase subunit of ABC transporter with duplicated ATPase domains
LEILLLKVSALTCAHDGDLLFANLDLVLGAGDRIGVVGPNGAGKTTLLRTLAGERRPDQGTVTSTARIAHVAQEIPDAGGTVGDFLRNGLGELAAVTTKLRELEKTLENASATGENGPENADDVLDEYGAVQERWTALEGWNAEARLTEIRQRLDIGHLADDRPLRNVSGGEQARLMLARALLDEPGILLLDEPTNHLDAEGAAWLQQWLATYPGGVLAVSHDRAFLDATVTRIIELDGIHDEPQDYPGGGYTAYRAEKQRRWEKLLLDYEAQEKDHRRWEADIERTKEQARGVENTVRSGAEAPHLRRVARLVARKAKVRERRLRRQMASVGWIARPRTRPPLTLAFPDDAGDQHDVVLKVRDLTVAYDDRILLEEVDLDVRRGDRILITGRNGAGKTTLLNKLAGGETAVLPQTDDGLRTNQTMIGFFRERVPVYIDDAEKLLQGHQFGPDQWDSRLSTLSAGELRRLLLAVLVNSPARILLLDEPTNFLDFDALDVVEEALRRYRGTLVIVTHDRYFAGAVGTARRWHVADGEVIES